MPKRFIFANTTCIVEEAKLLLFQIVFRKHCGVVCCELPNHTKYHNHEKLFVKLWGRRSSIEASYNDFVMRCSHLNL